MGQISLHGGDIYGKQIRYDFSVNGNPLGLAPSIKAEMAWRAANCEIYPEYGNIRLRKAVAMDLSVEPENVLCGNGASELFAAIVHGLCPKKVVIPQPAFYGYEWAAQMAGAQIDHVLLEEKANFAVAEDLIGSLTAEVDLLFLASPSNPAGGTIKSQILENIVKHCMEKGITVILDECFIEFTGKEGAIRLARQYPNLILVRAFTKIYNIPGVRLGYLIADAGLCDKIQRQLPEWNLSVIAQHVGLVILNKSDKEWDRISYLTNTIRLIGKEREKLITDLINIFGENITIFPSEANFILLKTKFPLYEKLLTRGILIRDCSNYRGLEKGFYRIAVRGHEENAALTDVIQRLVKRSQEAIS